jgi:HPt (histidine-containing phosphotransfer) domain-containing protein
MMAEREFGGAGSWSLPEELREFAAEDDSGFLADLIETFQTDTTRRLHRVQGAVKNGDFVGIRQEAHAIKGGARQVGAYAIAELCQEIELFSVDAPAHGLVERVNRLAILFAAVCRDMCSAEI